MTPSEYNIALGKHLKTLRLAHKYKQSAMAYAMGLSGAASYGHYEKGEYTIKAHMLYLIEKEFKLDAGSIMNQIVEGIWIR